MIKFQPERAGRQRGARRHNPGDLAQQAVCPGGDGRAGRQSKAKHIMDGDWRHRADTSTAELESDVRLL